MVSCFWLYAVVRLAVYRKRFFNFGSASVRGNLHTNTQTSQWMCLCVVFSVQSTRRVHFNWSTAHVRRAPFTIVFVSESAARIHTSTWWVWIHRPHSTPLQHYVYNVVRESLRWRIAIDEHTRTVRRTHALFTPTPSRRHYTPRPFTMATMLCDSKERRKNVFFCFRFSIYSFSALASASAHTSCPSSSSFCCSF